jgi:hypothetical protein
MRTLRTIVVVIVAGVIGAGSAWYTQKNNGPIEEACEAIIDYELHLPPGTTELSVRENVNNSSSQIHP